MPSVAEARSGAEGPAQDLGELLGRCWWGGGRELVRVLHHCTSRGRQRARWRQRSQNASLMSETQVNPSQQRQELSSRPEMPGSDGDGGSTVPEFLMPSAVALSPFVS